MNTNQGEGAMIRADDREDAELQGFENLQTEEEVAEFEAWLDGLPTVDIEFPGPEDLFVKVKSR